MNSLDGFLDTPHVLCMAITKEQRDFEAKVVKSHEKWVAHIAKRYLGRGYDYADLVQEGHIGLLKAARNWKPEAGASLATYAKLYIQCAIRSLIGQKPDGTLNDVPDEESLNAKEDDSLEGEALTASQNKSPEELAIEAENSRVLFSVIDSLPAHQRQIMRLVLDADELTNEEIGAKVNRSRARVFQLRTDAVVQMKKRMS